MEEIIVKCDNCEKVVDRKNNGYFELRWYRPKEWHKTFHYCSIECLKEVCESVKKF